MQVLLAHVVESADDAAPDDAPKALDGIGVHRANHVLMPGVIDGGMLERLFEIAIADPLIGADQANLVRNGIIHKSLQRRSADVLDDAGDNVALAANSASNDCLA
jgi:hypothetical protein